MLNFFPDMQFFAARSLLEEHNWDLKKACAAKATSQRIKIHLRNKANSILLATESFDKSLDAMCLIEFLL